MSQNSYIVWPQDYDRCWLKSEHAIGELIHDYVCFALIPFLLYSKKKPIHCHKGIGRAAIIDHCLQKKLFTSMYRCLLENYYNVVVNLLYNGCSNEKELPPKVYVSCFYSCICLLIYSSLRSFSDCNVLGSSVLNDTGQQRMLTH